MKKIVLMVAVMMIAAPAMAAITFAVEDLGNGTFTVSYTSTPAEAPRGVAIKVTVADYDITGIVADSQMAAFNANIDDLYDGGTFPNANANALAKDGAPGRFVSGNVAVISAGVLDQGGFQGAGPSSGDLITIVTDMIAGDSTTVTLSADGLRGPDSGVVGSVIPSNLSSGGTVVVPLVFPVSGLLTAETAILPATFFENGEENRPADRRGENYHQYWLDAGSPDCFAYPSQCHADADGRMQGSQWTGYYKVGSDDLNVLFIGWGILENDPVDIGSSTLDDLDPYIPTVMDVGNPDNYTDAICADFNLKMQGSQWTGYYRVGSDDLNILFYTWADPDPTVPSDCGGSLVPPAYTMP